MTEQKYYEYGQKVKLLSHRKMQTDKNKEASFLLFNAAVELHPRIMQKSAEEMKELLPILYEVIEQLVNLHLEFT